MIERLCIVGVGLIGGSLARALREAAAVGEIVGASRNAEHLQRAVDLGCNFFDTAWAYGGGRSEALLGKLVRANPDKKLYTATKIPPKNRIWPSRREFSLDDCFPPDHIEEYVHKSLGNPVKICF